ncbi:MAG: 23S rRNA (adenine(2503)-C(2))-methyltransferase RlmN [Phycisphaerae bacterium]|nr:23S rRNA (adenine(2503)-C(2))-methyltransferase RlmN [Phycisphaerae bacterium]
MGKQPKNANLNENGSTPNRDRPVDLKDLSIEELSAIATWFRQKPFMAGYIFNFIHTHGMTDIDQISPLPKRFRQRLAETGCFISQLKLVQSFTDPDGTVKFLFETVDGCRIESVLLSDQDGRRTLCISTQAGCRMGCAFCATGKLKFQRNLSAAEIVDQFYLAERYNKAELHGGRIGNVVYMGMGEPFDNYDAVMRSIRLLHDPAGRNLGQRHITVSTCGIPEGIVQFAGDGGQVRLAISLHAPTNEIRQRIMVVARTWTIDEVLSAVREYQRITGRRVTFEYCLIQKLNDSDGCAHQLIGLIRNIDAAVNLIEYNPHPGCAFQASDARRIERFQSLLLKGGIETVVRYKRGQTICAACGQLGADRLSKRDPKTQSPENKT